MEVPEGRESQSFDHHLHAQISHVPPGVVDDVVDGLVALGLLGREAVLTDQVDVGLRRVAVQV